MSRFMFAAVAALLLALPSSAFAFCGFYIGGAGAELFNDASQVVLMRDGTKTILSMQNRYEGPVDDFAMVIPVPQVLMEANVKTLPDELFTKLDTLTAPRLVEYHEQDPCWANNGTTNNGGWADAGTASTNNSGVVVEAQFEVGEYEIVVLSATESTSLETWLTENQYNLPTGAGPYYQPYIDAGMYFFVAKVDPAKVTFDGSRALLSPLRFDFESQDFFLPIRLGMINSAGQQDIIVHILARGQRYELANYPNATIPTNLEVTADTRERFGEFYKSLYAKTLKLNPGAIITEYSWQASNCDPCPGPVVDASDLLTLGADVLGNDAENDFSWVITRLHARYDKDEIGEDLIFQKADAIAGGREFVVGTNGELEQGAQPSDTNTFQARYIIRHPWTGEIECDQPGYGYWGEGQNTGSAQGPTSTGEGIAAPEDFVLEDHLVTDAPEIETEGNGTREDGSTGGGGGTEGGGTEGGGTKGTPKGGCSTTVGAAPAMLVLFLVGLGLIRRRR